MNVQPFPPSGGTGITPMLQLIRKIFSDPTDTTKVSLIFANVTEDDILLRSELDKLAEQHPKQFSVYYTLDKPPKGWKGGKGFVDDKMAKDKLPGPQEDGVIVFVCGPPGMVGALAGPKAGFQQGEVGGVLQRSCDVGGMAVRDYREKIVECMEVSSIGDSLEKQVPRNQYLAFDPIKAPKEARYALWPKLKIAVPNVPCILLLRHVEHVPSSHSATTNPRNQHGFAVHTPTVRGRLQRFPGTTPLAPFSILLFPGPQRSDAQTPPLPLQIPATRVAADKILTSFRQTPTILPACQYILGESGTRSLTMESASSYWDDLPSHVFLTPRPWPPRPSDNTQATMVQFQAALAIKEIVVREYTLYNPKDIIILKHYLLNYCLQRPSHLGSYIDRVCRAIHPKCGRSPFILTTSVPKYVRDQLLLVRFSTLLSVLICSVSLAYHTSYLSSRNPPAADLPALDIHTQAIAIITKRSYLDSSDAEKETMFTNVRELLGMAPHGPIMGIAFASALVDQFSSTKASNVGLSWEFHQRYPLPPPPLRTYPHDPPRANLPRTTRPGAFNRRLVLRPFCLAARWPPDDTGSLREPSAPRERPSRREDPALGVRDYRGRQHENTGGHVCQSRDGGGGGLYRSYEAEHCVSKVVERDCGESGRAMVIFYGEFEGMEVGGLGSRIGFSWGLASRDTVYIVAGVDGATELYTLVQDDTAMSHRCRQCLVQLSGIKSDLFENEQTAKEYAGMMMHGLLRLMNDLSNNPPDDESTLEYGPHLLGITQMIRRLLENIPLPYLCAVLPFFQFLSEVAKLSSTCLRDTMNEVEEEWSMEAFDECLEAWVKLADDAQSYSNPANGGGSSLLKGANGSMPGTSMASFDVENLKQFLRGISYHVVETYVDTRLELAKFAVQGEEEEVEGGFKDWVGDLEMDTFADQLISIATLARLDPHKSLLQLQRLLNDRVERLKSYFQTGNGDGSDQYLAFLHEHLNWLILISAHVLADSGSGEKPLVPDTLMRLSVSQAGVGIDNDQVVSISRTLLGLLEFLSSFSVNSIEHEFKNSSAPFPHQASYCSPRVSETLFWFVERWSKTYLLVDEAEYGFMSANIARAFGKPGPSDGQGPQVLDFLIDRIRSNFVLWNADPDVLVQIVRLLNSFARTPDLRNGLLQSGWYHFVDSLLAHKMVCMVSVGKFPQLITFFAENIEQLPEVIHSSLVQCIATIATGASNPQVRTSYFKLITDVIEKRLAAVLHRPDFAQTYQIGDVLSQVLNALEMFDGLALACETSNSTIIFSFCARFFNSFIQLLSVYSTVPEVQLLVLQFFGDFVRYLVGIAKDFTELTEEQKQLLYGSVVELLNSYSAANLGPLDDAFSLTHFSLVRSRLGACRKRMLTQEEEADEPYGDISTMLEMLSSVMASEFEGYARNEPTPVKPVGAVNVSDVVFFGVNIVIPLIDLSMLKVRVSNILLFTFMVSPLSSALGWPTTLHVFDDILASPIFVPRLQSNSQFPKLCSLYVRLISHLVEFFPDKLVGLPVPLFDNLMDSLEFGIDHDIGDVSRLTLQAISPLALWSHNEEVRMGPEAVKHLQGPLNKFLQNIVQLLLFKDFDSDLTDAASEALLSLICSQNVRLRYSLSSRQ
ncbi:hypothetical protein BC938DRAFT_481650 [Jimgerdemannia flammicorona]|uniref:Exportin-4 n=1 Tax=Jimgerdemannia flammicorona TaxID=994334 RepID=A0A433QFP0_9FUNG|nr:hypothetical protein BC938DRAFT_481650 [Jimgerdemannia flammicorona]